MSDEFGFEELPAGRYEGMVEKVRFYFSGIRTNIVLTYALSSATGIRRVQEEILVHAPRSTAAHFKTTRGLGRIEDILRTKGQTLAVVSGLKDLPGLLEGVPLVVVIRSERIAGYNTPVVVRIEPDDVRF